MANTPIGKLIIIAICVCLVGCETVTKHKVGSFGGSGQEDVFVIDFEDSRTQGALFIEGKLVNNHGSDISNVVLKTTGYDKNNQPVSTDVYPLPINPIKHGERVPFSVTLTRNADKIAYYFIEGRYGFVGQQVNVDWKTVQSVATVILVAAAVTAVVYAASQSDIDWWGGGYSGGYSGPCLPGDVWVNSRINYDGTYVQGHCRSAPDGILFNNYSYCGNINPYTGAVGTVGC